ncbi:oligosaccharide flippase family protein [Kordiimonas marina]|uniref:oligosaccharide flippase family protein n=1 Tax=Kordiimonas marina TaxID=2872312 RepID=UPI001FF4E9FD|nr:oligosaccharide flippase family protein [Kordiimonas marina]MCJ9429148.1 oligosaccharide flippase family protein [Kordiimonas marina]
MTSDKSSATGTGGARLDNIGQRVARGVVWTTAMRLSMRLFGLANVAVLARVLTKADFGLIALMISTAAVLTLVLDTLMRVALVRLQTVRDEHYGAAFFLRAAGGLIVWLILAAASGPLADFYGQPRLMMALIAFGGIVFVEGLVSPWPIAFQRNLEFHKDFAYEVVPSVMRVVATIGFALWLKDFWAVPLGLYAGSLARIVLSYSICPFRSLKTDASAVRDLWYVVKWALVETGASFSEERIDRLLLGRVGTAGQLGVFSAVLDLAALPVGNLVLPIGRAILPGLQHVRQAGAEKMKAAYSLSLGGMIACCIPVAAGLALVADPLIRTVFGDRWADAITLLQLAAGFALADGVLGAARQLLLAEGRLRALTAFQWIRAFVYVPAMIGGFYLMGLEGAVLAKSLVALLALIPVLWHLARTVRLDWGWIASQVLRSTLATIGMAAAIVALMPSLKLWLPESWAQLIIIAAFGAAVFGAVLLALWALAGRPDGLESRIVGLVTRKRAA